MSILRRKKTLLFAIFFTQAALIVFTYVINPGRTAITLTAFQPDTINSVCIASHFAGDHTEFVKKVDSLISYFKAEKEGFKCPEKFITTYKTRVVLPLLLLLFGQIGPWYFLLFPSIVIFFAIGFIYWRITANYAVLSTSNFLLTVLPFTSPHIVGHFANLMSEGPAALSILLLLKLTNFEPKSWIVKSHILIFVIMVIGLGSRQIWPIISVILLNYYLRLSRQLRAREKLPMLIAIASVPLAISKAIEKITSYFLISYGEDEWRVSILAERPVDAIKGLWFGITDDLVHVLRLADLAFIVFNFLLIMSLRKMNQRSLLIFGTCICWGLATISFVYLADLSFGQNFRFLVFGFFFAPVLIAQQENKA